MVFQKKLWTYLNTLFQNTSWGGIGGVLSLFKFFHCPKSFQFYQSIFRSHQSHTSPRPNPKGFMGWITDSAETVIQTFFEYLVVYVSTMLHFVDKSPVCLANLGELFKSPKEQYYLTEIFDDQVVLSRNPISRFQKLYLYVYSCIISL